MTMDTFGSGGLFRYDGSPFTTWRTASWNTSRTGTSFPSSRGYADRQRGHHPEGSALSHAVLHRLEHGVPLARAQDASDGKLSVSDGPNNSSKRSSRTSRRLFPLQQRKQEFDYIKEGFLLLGYTRASFRKPTATEPDNLVHSGRPQTQSRLINSQICDSDYDTVEYRVTKADGRILWLSDKA